MVVFSVPKVLWGVPLGCGHVAIILLEGQEDLPKDTNGTALVDRSLWAVNQIFNCIVSSWDLRQKFSREMDEVRPESWTWMVATITITDIGPTHRSHKRLPIHHHVSPFPSVFWNPVLLVVYSLYNQGNWSPEKRHAVPTVTWSVIIETFLFPKSSDIFTKPWCSGSRLSGTHGAWSHSIWKS